MTCIKLRSIWLINNSFSCDRMSQPQTESYTAAKGGIAALTYALAASLSRKVRVNYLSPCWIDTAYRGYEGLDALQLCREYHGHSQYGYVSLFLKAGFITRESICIYGCMTKLMIYYVDYGWNYAPED